MCQAVSAGVSGVMNTLMWWALLPWAACLFGLPLWLKVLWCKSDKPFCTTLKRFGWNHFENVRVRGLAKKCGSICWWQFLGGATESILAVVVIAVDRPPPPKKNFFFTWEAILGNRFWTSAICFHLKKTLRLRLPLQVSQKSLEHRLLWFLSRDVKIYIWTRSARILCPCHFPSRGWKHRKLGISKTCSVPWGFLVLYLLSFNFTGFILVFWWRVWTQVETLFVLFWWRSTFGSVLV